MRNARVGPWYDAFTERLRTAITDSGMSHALLAERLGVTESAVSRWTSGRVPEPHLLPRIATVLGLSIEELFGARVGPEVQRPRPPAQRDAGPASLVRSRLTLLDGDEVMFLRLDPPKRRKRSAPTIAHGSIIMVDELLDSGDTHVVVGRVINPRHIPESEPAHEEERPRAAGGAHAPLGRQHPGKARSIRRQPSVVDRPPDEEDDPRAEHDPEF